MGNYRSPDAEPSSDGDHSPATLTQRVYDALRNEILSGEIQPGSRLVRRVLSKRLGVSPMPVTEALLRLEVDGLVEHRPLHGAWVRPLSLDEVRGDEALREAIECQVARECAVKASGAELSTLGSEARVLDRMMYHGDPRSKLGMQMHLDFHTRLGLYSGFRRLGDELMRVWFRRLMRLHWVNATYCKPVPKTWHESLVDAIASRDPDAAERAMREHVRYGADDDRKALEFMLQETSGVD